jgi:Outer membrane protein beta-barrel domain
MMRPLWALLIAVSVVTPPGGKLEAQSAQAISLQGSGLFNGVFGRVFQGLQNGYGGEAQIRYTPSAFSIGAGFQYTVHNITNATEDAKLYGAFIEPRYRIHTGSYVLAPYVSARFALLKVGFTGGNLSISSNFLQLNGGGGLLYRLGPRVNLDVGATYGYDRLGAGTVRSKRTGTSSHFNSSSGSNVVFRLGFAFGIGG